MRTLLQAACDCLFIVLAFFWKAEQPTQGEWESYEREQEERKQQDAQECFSSVSVQSPPIGETQKRVPPRPHNDPVYVEMIRTQVIQRIHIPLR